MKAFTALLAFAVTLPLAAAVLSPQGSEAWNNAVKQKQEELVRSPKLKAADLSSIRLGRVVTKGAQIWVEAAEGGNHAVPSGFLHDWVGYLFIPEANAQNLLAVLKDYSAYKDLYAPAVTASAPLSQRTNAGGGEEHFEYRLSMVQNGFGVKTMLRATFKSRYREISEHEGFSLTEATELQEVRRSEGGAEEDIPFAKAKGFVERSFTIVHYSEMNGGVIVRVESLVLSRDIPRTIRWVAMPLIRKFAAQTMTATLSRLNDGVVAEANKRQPRGVMSATAAPSFPTLVR